MLAPTLLIGLGGKGSDIVCRVSKLVSESQRKSIGFCVFDTDINELREIREANPHVYTVQTSTSLTVGEYLNLDQHARDNWFPVNPILSSKTLTEGAGQVRAISRLAFDTAVRAGNMLPLHNAIEDLYRLEEGGVPQALRVIIVSTLAGGTGSGLILPVALYVRNFLKTRFRQSANITRGFFILPEVLFEVVHGESERNNLKCNAYATLRELDAFLMKGDGTLPERFNNKLHIEFPRAGSEDFEEYDIRPYDYCFLFDAQNIEGKKLNNFEQYLDHAANCIYAQSIGPMNKRSNSSEDNTIRALCRESGRNRYAGAGTSMLLYPGDDVRIYICMDWIRQCVSDQWLRFDEMMLQKQKNDLLMREKGISTGSQASTGESYINTVNNMVGQGDPFAISVVDQCTEFDMDGVTRLGTTWESYLTALGNYAIEQSQNLARLKDVRKTAETNINNAANKSGAADVANSLRKTYEDIRRYEKTARQAMDESAKNAAYSLFNTPSTAILGDKQPYIIESWMRDNSNNFIHPNAIRYFLYQTDMRIGDDIREVENRISELEQLFSGFDKKTFDNPDTEKVETFNDLGKDLGFFERFQKMPERYDGIIGSYRTFLKNVDELLGLKYRQAMLSECKGYVDKLCDTFESFYMNFNERLKDIRRAMVEIKTKFAQTAGKTTRYVCASANCLDKFVQQYTYTGSAISVDGKLSNSIYTSIRNCALQNDKKGYKAQFNAIFEQGLVGYFIEKLDKTYGSSIDMDIIDALEREAEYEKGYTDSATVEKYVRDIITSTRALSNPFIERPLGEQKAPIAACSYHPCLNPKDDSPRAVLVNDILNNFGAVPDTDIERNMIMFYQSIYALRANDLSKFAPALPGVRSEGEYYKAYYEVISKIMPKSEKTPVVTPHIDKTWHIVSNMPDLDESSHKAQETRIYRAFFLGLAYELITYAPSTSRKYLYKLNVNSRRSEEFVVSNKTPCDKFYEVLDALTVNPVIVDTILNFSKRKLDQELHKHKILFENCELMNGLNHKLRMLEYGRYDTQAEKFDIEFDLRRNGAKVTLFDIVALLKLSTPADAFHKSVGLDIMRVMLDVCHEYMARMTAPEKLDMTYGHFVVSQYDTFKRNNLNWFLEYDEFGDYIDELVRVCSEKLEELDLIEEQDQLDAIWRSTLPGMPVDTSDCPSVESILSTPALSSVPDMKPVTPSVSFTLPTGQQISIPVDMLPKETRDAISMTMQKVLSEEMKEASDLLKDDV